MSEMNRVQASQLVPSKFTADPLPTRAAEGQRRIHLVLDPEQRIENHRSAIVEVDVESIEAGVRVEIGIVAIDLERLHPHRASGSWPLLPRLDARFRCYLEVSRYGKPL
jgi:hypothetical protein